MIQGYWPLWRTVWVFTLCTTCINTDALPASDCHSKASACTTELVAENVGSHDFWDRAHFWDPLGLNPWNWFRPRKKHTPARQKNEQMLEMENQKRDLQRREEKLAADQEKLEEQRNAAAAALSAEQAGLKMAQRVNRAHDIALERGRAAEAAQVQALAATAETLQSLLRLQQSSASTSTDQAQSNQALIKVVADQAEIEADDKTVGQIEQEAKRALMHGIA